MPSLVVPKIKFSFQSGEISHGFQGFTIMKALNTRNSIFATTGGHFLKYLYLTLNFLYQLKRKANKL